MSYEEFCEKMEARQKEAKKVTSQMEKEKGYRYCAGNLFAKYFREDVAYEHYLRIQQEKQNVAATTKQPRNSSKKN